ncbi:MAG TPA: alanine racemase [Ruminiclostridium sp.]|nr:alanine racemase [Ruminiclostridium sp.]
MKILELIETPSVVIDMERVYKNLKTMSELTAACGCSLRPHIKTHKIPEFAKLQLKYGASGITCAKVSEAEVMADAGITDIFVAYPLVGEFRISRAIDLAKRIRLILGVDSVEGAVMLSKAAQAAGVEFEVRLEIDTGLRRTGIPFDTAEEICRAIADIPAIRVSGIYTFRGLILNGGPTTDNRAAGYQEGELMTGLANRLRAAGLDIWDVSCGSTPTGRYAAEINGVTEIRPGTYIFQDYMQVCEGSCTMEECAASVLVTVVSTPSDSYAVVDGGSKTFGTDFPVGVPPYNFKGYGYVKGNSDLVLSRVNEEHGIITGLSGTTGLKVGQRLLIVPVHVCSTVNLHNHIWLMEEDKYRKVRVEARGMLV